MTTTEFNIGDKVSYYNPDNCVAHDIGVVTSIIEKSSDFLDEIRYECLWESNGRVQYTCAEYLTLIQPAIKDVAYIKPTTPKKRMTAQEKCEKQAADRQLCLEKDYAEYEATFYPRFIDLMGVYNSIGCGYSVGYHEIDTYKFRYAYSRYDSETVYAKILPFDGNWQDQLTSMVYLERKIEAKKKEILAQKELEDRKVAALAKLTPDEQKLLGLK
jgi:hypothetical protein